jgi:hypothetical protein
MSSTYHEPELTQPVNLCNSNGNLNPAAVGWSRHPLHHCNLKGHWLRKKRWNYWAIVSPTHLFSVTLSDIDYLGLPFIYLLDFETKTFTEKTLLKPFGAGCHLPALVDGDVVYQDPTMQISMLTTTTGTHLTVGCSDFGGKPLTADFLVHRPAGHETLNVVIPWSANRFQFTSKQNTLPTEGTLQWGDETIHFNPKDTFACLDLGRGMWPFTCFWNWSSFSTRLTDGRTVGVNLGAGWTDGTGMNENALCVDGVLTKIGEDLFFDYNADDFMAPWHVHTTVTDRVDLKFTPFYERIAKTDALVIRSEVHQMIGYFTGTLKPDQGEPIDINNVIGWAEDHHARW